MLARGAVPVGSVEGMGATVELGAGLGVVLVVGGTVVLVVVDDVVVVREVLGAGLPLPVWASSMRP